MKGTAKTFKASKEEFAAFMRLSPNQRTMFIRYGLDVCALERFTRMAPAEREAVLNNGGDFGPEIMTHIRGDEITVEDALNNNIEGHMSYRVAWAAKHFGITQREVWYACVHFGLSSAVRQFVAKRTHAAFKKVFGLISTDGSYYEAIGFDAKGCLSHLMNGMVKPVSLKHSVKQVWNLEKRFQKDSLPLDSEQDDEARLRWFKMLHASVKK